MNPCPCGYLGEVSGRCRCPPAVIARYRARISGPLLDRIDLRVEVPAVPSHELLDEYPRPPATGSSAAVARRVAAVRAVQQQRSGKLNADLVGEEISRFCGLDRQGRLLLSQARARLSLSARGLHRVLRVARTIADLGDCAAIRVGHVAEALQLRRDLGAA